MIEKIENIDEKGFIRAYKLPDDMCDQIVEIYNNAPDEFKNSGKIMLKGGQVSNSNLIKKSTDLVISAEKEHPDSVLGTYFKHIGQCFKEYMKEFKILDTEIPLGIKEGVGIQYYKPSEGYYQWHFERHYSYPGSERAAVFMTYLNDVDEAGTDFLYQKFTSQAKKGLTLIWPADWTHTHKGQISEKDEKYIITGWISWCPEMLEK